MAEAAPSAISRLETCNAYSSCGPGHPSAMGRARRRVRHNATPRRALRCNAHAPPRCSRNLPATGDPHEADGHDDRNERRMTTGRADRDWLATLIAVQEGRFPIPLLDD